MATDLQGDDGRTLVLHREYPDPIGEVWAALTESDRLARWIGTHSGLNQVRRRLETESNRVSDVEVAHTHAARLDSPGFRDDVANRVGKPMDTRRNGHRPATFNRWFQLEEFPK